MANFNDAELFVCIAHIMSDISDIAKATGKTLNITAKPDDHPMLFVDGLLDDDFQFEEIPLFEGTLDQLKAL